MKKLILRVASPLALVLASLLAGCATFTTPRGYIPDDKVVFLREKLEFGPIKYPDMTVDPYAFAPYSGEIDRSSPGFLKDADFERTLRPDYLADTKLYREVKGHLLYVAGLDVFETLRARLDAAQIEVVPPLPSEHGDKIKDYSNGAQYEYPASPDAKITMLNTGEYIIDFADNGSFKYFSDGSYTRTDGRGDVLFSFGKRDSSVTRWDGDTSFVRVGDFKRSSNAQGQVEFSSSPEPQYHFSPSGPGTKAAYTFFVKANSSEFLEYSVSLPSGPRFDYLPEGEQILVTQGSRAISIGPSFEKRLEDFDTKLNKTTAIRALFLPQGIALRDLAGPGLSHADINPSWPEGYIAKTVGPFAFLYTAKDEPLLAKLDAARLSSIEEADRRLSGFAAVRGRTILIPPSLEAYCRLHAQTPGSRLNWYPSGFETQDHIVMWPLSVPRYDTQAGQDYFFGQELYEILAHEYLHLLVGEGAGLLSPVPFWLNEGFAVYVESQFSADCKAYWDMTFAVARDRGRLLDWDQATLHGTGEFGAANARTHYAQSYALVSALIAKYGAAKVADYVRSFRAVPESLGAVDLKSEYRVNFLKVFGVEFDRALELIKKPAS